MNATDIGRQNAVEAKKIAYRQTKEGVAITFQIHPNDAHDDLRNAPLGQRYLLVPVRLGDDEQPESGQDIVSTATPDAVRSDEQSREGAPSKRRWREMPASQRAAILCGDAAFQKWLDETRPNDWYMAHSMEKPPADIAADVVREICGVFSRADLDKHDTARKRFERLEEDFNIASGRVPAPR